MYPYLRFAYHQMKAAHAPRKNPFETHVIHTRIWPQDLDPWVELNNGRTLTLYDLGRLSLFKRSGLGDTLRRQGWGGTVAGVSVRYRKRVTLWQRVEMRSRVLGWDPRFVYIAQSMRVAGECTSQVLLRTAIIENRKIVPTARVGEALAANGVVAPGPELPGWVKAWIEAEGTRPWPPED